MTRARESKDTRLKRIHHHHFSSFSSISIRVSVILVIGVEMKFPRGAITHRDSPQIKDNQIPADWNWQNRWIRVGKKRRQIFVWKNFPIWKKNGPRNNAEEHFLSISVTQVSLCRVINQRRTDNDPRRLIIDEHVVQLFQQPPPPHWKKKNYFLKQKRMDLNIYNVTLGNNTRVQCACAISRVSLISPAAVANSIRETLVVAVRLGYMFFIYNFVCFTSTFLYVIGCCAVFFFTFYFSFWVCFFDAFPFLFFLYVLRFFFFFILYVSVDSWHIRAAVCALTWASRQPTLLAAVPKVRPVHHLVADGSERV